jgi:predicted RNase H-like HicB family nuclease
MKLYRLPVVLYEPSEDTEDRYMAEVTILPGCRAWGDTPGEALENVQSVATAFLESYREHGDPLPPEVEATALESAQSSIIGEVLVVGVHSSLGYLTPQQFEEQWLQHQTAELIVS